MSRIVVITDAPELVQNVGYAAGGNVASHPASPVPTLAELQGRETDRPVVVLDARPDPQAALAFATACSAAGVVVVLASETPEEIGFAALKADVADVVSVYASIPEWRVSLAKAERVATERSLLHAAPQVGVEPETGPLGRIITIASPKGGVGKTTVATNVAVGLARRFPQSTVLVDLDVQFGDVATALGLVPQYTLVEASQTSTAADPLALKSMVTRHPSGLFVIPGSDSPGAADGIGPREIGVLLHTLASAFAYVVVDTAPGLNEHTLAALDQSTDLVLVTGLDVPGVRGLRKEVDTLRQVDLLLPSHRIVLNFADSHRGITVKDVEANVGEPVDIVVPPLKEVPMSVNQGIPLLQGNGRDQATKQLDHLVDLLVGAEGGTRRGRARWGRKA